MSTLRLTSQDVPDGSLIAVFNDVHIPHHDTDALKLAIECCEREGATHVIANGDIADCGPASRHEQKKKRAVLDEGCLRESVAAGMWLFDWFRTRECYYILGNHEAWVSNYIEQSPELKGTATTELLGLWSDGDGWAVLPDKSRLSIGNLTIEHGNALFPSGSGGQNPAQRIKSLVPDRTTIVGHLHREFQMFWTTPDPDGIQRTRGAFGFGHMSLPESHEDYAAYANWQQGIGFIRVYYVDGRPRFTITPLAIHRDRYGKPLLEHNGKLYR